MSNRNKTTLRTEKLKRNKEVVAVTIMRKSRIQLRTYLSNNNIGALFPAIQYCMDEIHAYTLLIIDLEWYSQPRLTLRLECNPDFSRSARSLVAQISRIFVAT